MQTCTQCGETKEVEAFAFKNKGAGRRHRKCKPCMAAYGRGHYARNRGAYISRNVANMRLRRRLLKQRVWRIVVECECVDCGERDPLVLDFDHVDNTTKRDTIYSLVQSGYGWQSVLDEIAKCQVRCANCHRRRTWVQFSWADQAKTQSGDKGGRVRGLIRPVLSRAGVRKPAEMSAGHRWCSACGLIKPLDAF